MQTGAATLENSMEIPQEIKNGTAFWPSDPTSGNISKEIQNTNSKEHKHPYVLCSVTYNCQEWKQPKSPSVDEWIEQLWNIYTMEYYLAIKKKKFYPLQWHDGPREHYAKWNKPVRERQIPYDFTYIWNIMNKLNQEAK